MDKNSLIGLFLIGLVIIGYTWMTAPSQADLDRQAAVADSTAQAQAAQQEQSAQDYTLDSEDVAETAAASTVSTPAQPDSAQQAIASRQMQDRYGLFAAAASGDDRAEYIIENSLIRAAVQAKGGQLKWLELKEFKTYAQEPLLLFDERSRMNFRFATNMGQQINTEDLYFKPTNTGMTEGANGSQFTMRLASNDAAKYVDLTYTLGKDNYEVDLSIDLIGMGRDVDLQRNDLSMDWEMTGLVKEKSLERENERSSVFYRYMDDERDYLSESKEDELNLEAKANWIAFKQNYFSAVAMHPDGFVRENSYIAIAVPEDAPGITKQYKAELTLPIEYSPDPHAEIAFYMGPNDYATLKAYDNEMDRIIDLGWGIFGWMNKWLVIPIFDFLNGHIASYGIIILILTVVIKSLLFPLTYKNYLSSAKMRVLKPEIDALNKKFENEKDPMKKQQATMGLYRKSGVNPAAGCIPMVVQMPILYAMFRFFPASIELRQQSFLWADDLSSYDSIASLPFEIPFYGDHVSLFTILMAVSTLIYTHLNSSQMPAAQPGMPNMKTIMYIFPVMMLFFFNSFASGLSYYYLLANLFSIGQMLIIKHVIIDEDKLRAKIKANQKKPVKKSAFQTRLEEAAKQRGVKTK